MVAYFLRNLLRAMARAILVTMSRNFVAKIWHSSLVMRQVSGCRLEGIRARPEVNTLLASAAYLLEKPNRAFQDTATLHG